MSRLRRIAAVLGLACALAVSTSGCIVVRGRRGCGGPRVTIAPLFHCFDVAFRHCH